YSPPQTEVRIAADLNHAGVIISVRDQGFGIPAEARERIFEKFYRLERDATSGVVGTGLGLSLVKGIVEQHGGQVTVKSAPMTGSKGGSKLDWALTEGAFERLLDWLGEDSELSGECYLEMRKRLVLYFDRKGCLSPDDLADETLNRVARRLEEEGTIISDAPA